MAIRTRAAWDTIVAAILRDNQTGNISALDMRSVLYDLGDSVVFRDELIDLINAELGGTTWQQGGGGTGTGVTLQEVLDAIRADGTVSGIELVKDTSQSDIITLRIQAVTVASHGRYAALVDNQDGDPADFPAAVFTAAAAVMANSDTIASPAYSGTRTFITLGFATPNRLTGIHEEGNTIAGNIRSTYAPAVGDPDVTITIPGGGVHYVYAGTINAAQAGNTYILTEETA